MAKRKIRFRMRSFGIYTGWDAKSKDLPKIREFTTEVPAILDIEFGFIVNIEGAKNQPLEYCIYHPNIPDERGNPRPPFDGTVYVPTNDWDFYLGDTVWEPIENKIGPWRMTLELKDEIIADKTFLLVPAESCERLS